MCLIFCQYRVLSNYMPDYATAATDKLYGMHYVQANHLFTTNMQKRLYGHAIDIHIRPLNDEKGLGLQDQLLLYCPCITKGSQVFFLSMTKLFVRIIDDKRRGEELAIEVQIMKQRISEMEQQVMKRRISETEQQYAKWSLPGSSFSIAQATPQPAGTQQPTAA